MAAPEKTLVQSKSGLRMLPIKATDTSPFTLEEPPWIPDKQCKVCMSCQSKFDFTRRRHHCRRCGRCYCGSCCDNKEKLLRMCFVDPVRQCGVCAEISKKENEFFDKHVKNLCNGGDFAILESSKDILNDSPTFRAKLSSNHRVVQFECDCDKQEPIQIQKIESVQIFTSTLDREGNSVASGIAMKYKDHKDDSTVIKMWLSSSANSRREGQLWIASMQKAFKMIHDARQTDRP